MFRWPKQVAAMDRDPSSKTLTNIPRCPKCRAIIDFRRSTQPQIDSLGLESYQLRCQECGAALSGIIDPADDFLILSEGLFDGY
jgi:hypothetical protein